MTNYDKDILINEFAVRTLRDTGDRDYVHARLAYRARLFPQFLWSSLQCLEKYCKCILVLNRISAIEIGYAISPAVAKLNQLGKFEILLSEDVKKFIDSLERQGAYRYFEVSWAILGNQLAELDRAVWELRPYCQPINFDVEIEGKTVNLFTAILKKIRDSHAREQIGIYIDGGWLEEVVEDINHPAREALVWNNPFIDSNAEKQDHSRLNIHVGNSPLWIYPKIVYEVEKHIKIPKQLKEGYQQLAQRKKA